MFFDSEYDFTSALASVQATLTFHIHHYNTFENDVGLSRCQENNVPIAFAKVFNRFFVDRLLTLETRNIIKIGLLSKQHPRYVGTHLTTASRIVAPISKQRAKPSPSYFVCLPYQSTSYQSTCWTRTQGHKYGAPRKPACNSE